MVKFNEDQLSKITEVVQNEEFYKELEKATSNEDVKAIFAKNGLDFTDEEIDAIVNPKLEEVNESLDHFNKTFELSEEELEMIAGGSFWSVFKTVVSFVPLVGTAAKLVCDLADGSLKGTSNIAARVGVTLAVGLFDAVTTIATGGALAIAKTAFTSGISAVGGRLAIYAGVTALSSGTGAAAGMCL